MAQYGTFTWGDTTLWGSSAVAKATHTWIVNVDWNGDGSYDGSHEGAYLIGCNIKRGREEYLNPSGSGFEHMHVGTATLTFDNSTRRYDPRYDAGPLYGYLKPGRKVQISAHDNSDESNYVLFTGVIDDIVPVGYAEQTIIKCVDYLQWLADQELTFDAELLNTTVTGALNHLLDQAQYPGGRNVLGSFYIDNQPIWVFGVNKENALTVANQIADAGLGMFYVDAYGNATYQRRDHATGGTGFTQQYFKTDIRISQPWDGVYNDVTVTRLRYVKQQPSIIFTLPEAVYIATGNSQAIEVNYEPSTDVQLSEIVANTRFDGNGTALTFTASAIDLGFTGGSITIANATGTNGYVTEISIRGRKYVDTQQKYNATDATSQAAYGIRRFQLTSPFLQDGGYASAFATILKDFLKDDRESLVVKLRGWPTYEQFYTDLYSGIVITSTELGLAAAEYRVLGIDHDWMNDNGQDVLTTWYLHKVLADSTAITSSSLETAPPVPPAPPGYDDPGGDPDTVDTTNQDDIPVTSPLAGTDHIFYSGAAVDAAGDLKFGDIIGWETPTYWSEDIDNGGVIKSEVWDSGRDDRIFLTQPGWYEVTVYGYLYAGTVASSTTALGVNLMLYSFTSAGGLAHAGQSMGYIQHYGYGVGDRFHFAASYVFPRLWNSVEVSYIHVKLENITPTNFWVNSRNVSAGIIVKRIRRPTESS